MGTDNCPGEPGKTLREISGPDPDNAAVDKKIAEGFLAVKIAADGAKGRVRAAVVAGAAAPVKRNWGARSAAAAALCGMAALMVLFLHRPGPAEPELSPDWRSDYNFPGYALTAAPSPEELAPDWRADYQFPGYQGGRDTSAL